MRRVSFEDGTYKCTATYENIAFMARAYKILKRYHFNGLPTSVHPKPHRVLCENTTFAEIRDATLRVHAAVSAGDPQTGAGSATAAAATGAVHTGSEVEEDEERLPVPPTGELGKAEAGQAG